MAQAFVDLYRNETGMTVKLCYNTLICGAAGWRSQAEANGAKSWLTKEETTVVITYITELGNHRFLLSHQRLKEYVDEILSTHLGDQFPVLRVGKWWTQRFIEKHSKDIKMSWATLLESKHDQAVNPHTIEAYFVLLKETITKYGITEDCTYGTDEIGCTPSEGQKERVMGGCKSEPQYQQQGGDSENTTVIVTVCADGTLTSPAMIFKGKGEVLTRWKEKQEERKVVIAAGREEWEKEEVVYEQEKAAANWQRRGLWARNQCWESFLQLYQIQRYHQLLKRTVGTVTTATVMRMKGIQKMIDNHEYIEHRSQSCVTPSCYFQNSTSPDGFSYLQHWRHLLL